MTEKPTCEPGRRLCTPSIYPGPSGPRLRHDHDCPDRPGEPISAREYAKGRMWPPYGRVRR
jgi:hypothetical protein